ncbi:MAG: polymer-forming cytoskeletal protein [Pseudomonadota bacterium]
MRTEAQHLAVAACILCSGAQAWAQPTGFEQIPYQGRLEHNGEAQTGDFDFQFVIEDVDGVILWSDVLPAVPVRSGNFAVTLGAGVPFPPGLWLYKDLYLTIQVRPKDSGAFTALAGRQHLLSVPYAQRSQAAGDYHVTGTLAVDNGASIAGDLDVTGQIVSGHQDVTGGQVVTGDVSVNAGGLHVDGPVTLGSTASVGGQLDVAGDVISLGRNDSVTNASAPTITTTYWPIHSGRYRLTIDQSYANMSYPVPRDILEEYCGDEDGCRVKIGMSGWNANTAVQAVVTANLTYAPTGDPQAYHYRFEYNESSSYVEGVDGDTLKTNLSCPYSACCLLDYRFTGVGMPDDELGLWLHWSVSAYNTATKKCILILED